MLGEGSLPAEEKERRILSFLNGEARVMISHPGVAGFGLNLQHCARMLFVGLGDSYEQYFQCLRRCWRFGQRSPVTVDLIATEGERGIKENLRRKSAAADRMFTALVRHMREALSLARTTDYPHPVEAPAWL